MCVSLIPEEESTQVYSLHGLEQEAGELEQKQAMSPTAKCSTEVQMASEDEEEGTCVQEEAIPAQNSPQGIQVSEEKEKCGDTTEEFEIGSVDVQKMLTVMDDDCSYEEHMDEVAIKDQPTSITRFARQDEDLGNSLAALSLTHTDPRLSSSSKGQNGCVSRIFLSFSSSKQVNMELSSPPDLA